MSKTIDLDLCFETAVGLAEDAGKQKCWNRKELHQLTYIQTFLDLRKRQNLTLMISEALYNSKHIEVKSGNVDLVTETDQKVEKFLIKSFQEKFPDHKFIGEESRAAGIHCDLTDSPTWIIDPVDGTMNFIHTFPFVAVSIGLAVNKEVVVGVVYNALLDKMYTARKGQGSFCNGKKLHVSGQVDLSQALILTEMGSSRQSEKVNLIFTNMTHLINKVHSFRATGSGALNMCTVASGEADAYYEFGIHCWDIAAGSIIVQEAGGTVIDTEGGPLDIMSRRLICAGSSTLAQSISKELKHMVLERD